MPAETESAHPILDYRGPPAGAWFDRPQAERLGWLAAQGMSLEDAAQMDKAMRAAFFRGSLHGYCRESSRHAADYDHPLLQAAYDAGAGEFQPGAGYRIARALVLAAMILTALAFVIIFGAGMKTL